MKVLILNQAEVTNLLPMKECMDVMAEALKALGRGEAILPLRPVMWLPERVGALGMMPAYLANINSMGVKVISVFPGNRETTYDSHQGAVLLFEAKHGTLLALMDASSITAIRTAAVSGVATQLLARADASDLAILGSGVQAGTHLEAMLQARKIRRVRIWSWNPDRAREFAEREARQHTIPISSSPTAQDAVTQADIICTTTSTQQPILQGAWLTPGCHINAVGSSTPAARELDTEAVVRSRFIVDRRESALNEAGDFLIPKKEGALGDDHIVAELGEVLLNRVPGRTSRKEITLFKSLGLAIEDLAAANHIYQKALSQHRGTLVELGGRRS